jgi:WD40 repeat protein
MEHYAREILTVRHDGTPDPMGNNVRDVAFSPDGHHLLTCGEDGTARIWTLAGQQVAEIAHAQPVSMVAFSNDGRVIATESSDGTVRRWLWREQDLVEHVCRRVTRNLSRDEWRTYFGTVPYEETCAGLPLPK